MTTQTAKLYSLPLVSLRTIFAVMVFVAANVAFPQAVHLIPQGGLIFLPIYFFTIVAAYKYGLAVGLLTAVLSPLTNHLFFEMPSAQVLPILIIKGVLAATAAALVARKTKSVAFINLIAVVLAYQVLGSAVEWGMTSSFAAAAQDFKIGLPGMALQIVGGYALIKFLCKE
ncbi:MAG: hypothetical protein PHD21_05340 [Flavobacteriales bacterium]|nr:hypothetical protein [Flavobacteriales bacterium]